ncbi:hypothetical protein NDU88_001545 [Pleurodeles waltl]|uniref:Gypsy retrotransposon integrase-like protein 1 n=1 Tax=Pleurodeles waltl TaxID=8319 RepID=A0AAV7KWJ3_PLEWA|nr:hypothetical protein NDU88_001545 [Pleurodeles waltl]
MPFGLCNAPAAFQFFLNDVLREYLDIFAIVYIDDILIYSDNENEHVQHVKKMLAALRKHHLYCKLTKCEFHVTTVEFLGVILTPQGMVMAERKGKAVSEWPMPKTVRDVQCFLGFANFYRRFINHFSQTVAPITKLLRKKEKCVWSPEADQAFSTLKEAFSTAPVLTHPDADRPFIVEADASDVAIGAVLSERNKDTGQLHPVAYMSQKLNEAEQNYVIAEKELLVICDAFKEWRHHLLGAKYTVTVYTDHRNLKFMSSARLLTPRHLRWMLFFAEFDFVVTFLPGKDNRKADALSCQEPTTLPAVQTSRAVIVPDKVLCIIKTEDFFEDISNSFTVEKWQAWAQADPKRSIKQGLPFHDACLFVPTTKLRKIVFHWLHVIPTAGHPGTPKTLELIQRYFWWPILTKDVKTMVNNCKVCARTKTSHSKPKGLLHPLRTPSRAWENISLDFITGLPVVQQHSVIPVVVDNLTKYGHFIACKKLPTSSELASILLNRVVRYHGLPKVILSDRGSQFASNFWKTWCKTLQVTSTLSTSHHPQTDGQMERLNQTLKQYLRAYAEKALNSWTSMLWLAELAYNNSFHTSTGVTPFFGLFGYHPDTLPITIPQESSLTPAVSEIIQHLHQTQKSIQQHLEKAKKKYKNHYDKKHCEGPQYQPGDKVWLSTKTY